MIPIILIIFSIIFIVISIIQAVLRSDRSSVKSFFNELEKNIFLMVIAAAFLFSRIAVLARGGIHLCKETEKDKIEITGMIEDTFEISFGDCHYHLEVDMELNNSRGEGIVIDGTKYYLITYGDFKKGDTVTITVLPKSKLILEIVPVAD